MITDNKLIIELESSAKGDSFFGSCDMPNYLIITEAKNEQEIEQNVRSLIEDHINNEGKSDPYYKDMILDKIVFEHKYI